MDYHTRHTWIYPLKSKSETFATFQQFKAQVEKQYGHRPIKIVRCDNEGEFNPFLHYGKDHDIEIKLSCPCTSVQNGRIERKHRHVVETRLTLLAQAKMSLHCWWEAFHTTVYLINRMSSPTIHYATPYFLIHGQHPDYKDLRAFRAACYPCLQLHQQ